MNKTCATIALCVAAVATTASGQVLYEDTKLLPSDGAGFDEFGGSIAIDNGVIAVGASGNDGKVTGSVYLFDASTGGQLFKLHANDGAEYDLFGHSIALDNGVVAIGARGDHDDFLDPFTGSAYLFDASTGAQLFKLAASDGEQGDEFGVSIAIGDGVVAVGVPGDDDNGRDSGSVYVFEVSTGAYLFKLLASDRVESDRFGVSVAIDNGVVAVGAFGNYDDITATGSAYLFDASTGAQLFKLVASDGAGRDSFGNSIALANGVVAVGAVANDDNGIDSGSAYLFDASTGKQLAKLLPSDGAEDDWFGGSIAIDNGVAVVSAIGDDDNGDRSGSAYVFDVTTLPCPGDIANELGELNPDGTVSFGDFMAMLTLVGPCPGMTPGCDGDIADNFGTPAPPGGPDGMVGFGDFLALLGLVGPCP